VSPRLTLGPIATTDDERLSNLALAWKTEPTIEGGTIRWTLEALQGARAALDAVKEVAEAMPAGSPERAELLEIVAEGLALPRED
jgi:hypothetical protein